MTLSFDIVTPSYPPDFERCRSLCESIDAYSAHHRSHIILVDREDYDLFAPLAGGRRKVVCAETVLPWWLRKSPVKLGTMRRRVWFTPHTLPVHGWHIQQVKKIAVCSHLECDVVLFADSDMVLVRPLEPSHLAPDGKVRLFRQDSAITGDMADHVSWLHSSARMLGCDRPELPADDFIGHMVTWRRKSVAAMCARIEEVSGCHWITALLRSRKVSEYLLYGLFVSRFEGIETHHACQSLPLCHTYFGYEPLEAEDLVRFMRAIDPAQVAIGVNTTSRMSNEDVQSVLRQHFPLPSRAPAA